MQIILDSHDLAYIAGFFDGDGCICVTRVKAPSCVRGYNHKLSVSLVQKVHCPLLDTLSEVYGGSTYHNPKTGVTHWQPVSRSAERFLRDILPYLRLKKDQTVLALEYMATVPRKRGSEKLTDVEYDYRDDIARRIVALKHPNKR